MKSTTVFGNKKDLSLKIKRTYGILLKFKPLGLIKITNKQILDELVEGLKGLSAGFVIYVKGEELVKVSNNIVIVGDLSSSQVAGFDFIVCDDEVKNLGMYLEKGVVPLISNDNHMSSLLAEFNPLKNEGNAFLYRTEDKWAIFASIIRYLENYKFPQDNRNLVKNVLKI